MLPQGLPTVPIIDIEKMPKYGMLSQPLPRAPRMAGTFVEYNRETHTFVKNRDLLREGLEHKSGYLESRPLLQWAEFAGRQKHRYVPIMPDANRRVLMENKGTCFHVHYAAREAAWLRLLLLMAMLHMKYGMWWYGTRWSMAIACS